MDLLQDKFLLLLIHVIIPLLHLNDGKHSKVQDLLRKSGAIQVMQERCRVLFEQSNRLLLESHLSQEEQTSIAEAIAWVRQTVRLGS